MFCWPSAVLFRAPAGQSVFFMRNPQIVDEEKLNVLTASPASALVRVVCIGWSGLGSFVLISPRPVPHRLPFLIVLLGEDTGAQRAYI